MVNTILAKRVNHIVAKGDHSVWPKGSKSRGFSSLKLNEERTTLKCYMGDTGLLISHAFDERGIVSADLYRKLMFDKLEVNEGMLVENIVAQMLRRQDTNSTFSATVPGHQPKTVWKLIS